MKIYGSITVPNLSWRYLYGSVINFFNEEIGNSHIRALEFYTKYNNEDITFSELSKRFDEYASENKISAYQDYLMRSALFKGSDMVKPKRNHFTSAMLNNRTTYINATTVKVTIDKDNHSLSIETAEFDDFDKYMATNSFISEFTTMINSIRWPSRTGPSKTVRGCTLVREDSNGKRTLYYQSGSNPPEMDYTVDETASEPTYLGSSMLRNIKISSISPDPMTQPIPEPEDLSDL